MNIDFFTLGAQIINLLVLLFLLRKFLYLPILKVLEERKTLLENEYKTAETARKKALSLEQKAIEEYEKIETSKQEILAQSHIQAEKLEQKLIIEAKQEFEKSRKIWKNKLLAEQNTFEIAIQNLIAEYFEKFASGALKQMADITLNELFLDKLMQKISAQNSTKKSQFERDFLSGGELEIISAKEINPKTKQKLKDFLQNEFPTQEKLKIKFGLDEKLICGVALKAKEQIIEWNLADYIAEFSNNLNTAVSSLIDKD